MKMKGGGGGREDVLGDRVDGVLYFIAYDKARLRNNYFKVRPVVEHSSSLLARLAFVNFCCCLPSLSQGSADASM